MNDYKPKSMSDYYKVPGNGNKLVCKTSGVSCTSNCTRCQLAGALFQLDLSAAMMNFKEQKERENGTTEGVEE